jgi:choline dehydrogenase
LPVGQVLYDHIAYLGLAFTINQTVEPREALFHPSELFNWVFNGTGVYTSLAGVEALAYINTGSIPDPKYPDIELIFIGTGSLQSDFGLVVANEIRLRRDIYDAVFKPIENTPSWSIIPMLLHPESRGYLKLRSNNPYDAPLLYGNFFTDPGGKDLRTFIAAIRYIQKLSRTEAFQRFNSQIHDVPIPGCEKHVFDSDDYWVCAVRSLSSTLHHQVGTCKMGTAGDPEAVVDPRLRVHGVGGLRVVDSSVIPVTISAHTNAPSIMIGEKASDIIKEDWSVL